MRIILTTLIAVILLTACGEKPVETIQVPAQATVQEAPKPAEDPEFPGPDKAFYLASDFGLPKGTVKDFQQENEIVQENHDKGSSEPIYITIIAPDGHIIATTCTYEAWLVLHPGDKLR